MRYFARNRVVPQVVLCQVVFQSVQGSYKQMSCKAAAKKQQAGNLRVAKHVWILVAWWKQFFAKSRGQRQSPISHWMLQAKQCDSPLCCTSKVRPPSRVHQAICSVVISARLLEVPRSTMAILWACVGGLVGPHLRETMFQGFRQNHPQQHPHLSSVHVFAVTPASMLPSWWWNVINLNKPVFSISDRCNFWIWKVKIWRFSWSCVCRLCCRSHCKWQNGLNLVRRRLGFPPKFPATSKAFSISPEEGLSTNANWVSKTFRYNDGSPAASKNGTHDFNDLLRASLFFFFFHMPTWEPQNAVRGSLATLPIGHLRPYPLKTRNTVTCDPTSFYCAHHTKLHLVTCDPTHHY